MPLIVKGFSKQLIVTTDEIIECVNKIPKNHLIGITSLVYDPSRFYQRSYVMPKPINYRVAAEYNSTPIDHILIYAFSNKEQFQHMLFHEVGHHVFKRKLDSVTRKRWVTEIYPNSRHVSDYAKTNASEDFAESYAFFIKKPQALTSMPKKLNFMQQQL